MRLGILELIQACVCVRAYVWQLHFANDCERLAGVDVNHIDGDCRDASTYYPIHASLRDFEVALVNAVFAAGFNITYLRVAADTDPPPAP